MQLTDTHAHLYLTEFDGDRDEMILRSIESGVSKILLPNIDSGSLQPMLSLAERYPGICYPMIGLHPTSVKDDYEDELAIVEKWLRKGNFIAIGEIGMDLYWDTSYREEQTIAFRRQIELSLAFDLPLVIHCREAFDEIFEVIDGYKGQNLRGVFHAFTGTIKQARHITDMGFYLGIGGIVTFKNSGLDSVVSDLGSSKLLLETDSPYLAPVPNRGKRNESSNIIHTARKISEICSEPVEMIAEITSANAKNLFNI